MVRTRSQTQTLNTKDNGKSEPVGVVPSPSIITRSQSRRQGVALSQTGNLARKGHVHEGRRPRITKASGNSNPLATTPTVTVKASTSTKRSASAGSSSAAPASLMSSVIPNKLNLRLVAERYLTEAEEYVEKAERFEKEAHYNMDEADSYSKSGEEFVDRALNLHGPDAIKLYEAARAKYNSARKCLEESVRCNDAATRNYRTARDYYECYGRCCPSCPTGSPTHSFSSASSTSSSSDEND